MTRYRYYKLKYNKKNRRIFNVFTLALHIECYLTSVDTNTGYMFKAYCNDTQDYYIEAFIKELEGGEN